MRRGPVDNLRLVLDAWLALFYADALLAAIDAVSRLLTGWRVVAILESISGLALVLTTPLVILGVLLSPRLRPLVFLPPILYVCWIGVGASPVTILLFDSEYLRLALAAVHVAVAAVTLLSVWWHEGRRSWRPTSATLELRPAFAWVRFAALGASSMVLAPVALVAYLWFSAAFGISHLTAGFVRLSTEGVRITHRSYSRGEQVVDLIGMIHLGDEAAYHQIFDPIPVEGSIVLAEGVSDEQGLLQGGTGYDRIAERLGISVQKPMDQLTRIEVRNADVDVSTFSASSLDMLRRVFALYRAEDLAPAILGYLQWSRSQGDPEAVTRALLRDILDLRNVHLLGELDAALADHRRVILPWGAYHLPDVERGVKDRGFSQTGERSLTLIPFRS